VNWKCGQESTFRLLAVTFAVAEFGRLPGATPERMNLVAVCHRTGARINAIWITRSANQHHGVSECVGLITASLLTNGHELGSSAVWLICKSNLRSWFIKTVDFPNTR